MFYFNRNPFFIRWLYHDSLTWNVKEAVNQVYLTFDDGPTPELTIPILEILKRFRVKATFFLVGENVERYPELFQRIMAEGHSVGSHTYNHLNALNVEEADYLENVEHAARLIPSHLFRPPHGKIKPSIIKKLKDKYQIVMWTILSGDFDPNVNPQKCFENATKKTNSGDIIVFHDNVKARTNVLEALPRTLDYFLKKGIDVKALPDNVSNI